LAGAADFACADADPTAAIAEAKLAAITAIFFTAFMPISFLCND
jgi:hypothetical protein